MTNEASKHQSVSSAKQRKNKQLVSVRYTPAVLAYFKSTGEGWQSRMDGALREYVAQHSSGA